MVSAKPELEVLDFVFGVKHSYLSLFVEIALQMAISRSVEGPQRIHQLFVFPLTGIALAVKASVVLSQELFGLQKKLSGFCNFPLQVVLYIELVRTTRTRYRLSLSLVL